MADEKAKETKEIKNKVKVSEAGPCKKKVAIEIPEEKIKQALEADYKELRAEAVIPGFRKGKAPMRLVEKRFGKDISEQVKVKLIAEATDEALKGKKVDSIGQDPDVDIEAIELPESGSMKFEFEVEVRPEFDLPSLEGIDVEKPKIEVTDKQVKEELVELQKRAGLWQPEDVPAEIDDQIIADVVVKIDGSDKDAQKDATEIFVRNSGMVAGVPVSDLDKLLVGAKAGDTKTTTVDVPKTFYNEEYREKKVDLEIKVGEVKKLVPAELNEDFFKRFGVDSKDDLKNAIRENAEDMIEQQSRNAMSGSVRQYLLDNTKFDLPGDVVADQSQQLLQRQYINMMMQGTDREKIEEQMEELRTSSEEQAKEQLKYFFIMDKIAEQLKVEVADAEINSHIAQVAAQRGRRPEKMREDMIKDGSLAQFSIQVREEKCIEKLLEKANIKEVKPKAPAAKKKAPAKKKATAKKATTKKTEPKKAAPKKKAATKKTTKKKE